MEQDTDLTQLIALILVEAYIQKLVYVVGYIRAYPNEIPSQAFVHHVRCKASLTSIEKRSFRNV